MSAILISVLPKTLQHLEIHGLEKNMLSDRDVEIIYVGIFSPLLETDEEVHRFSRNKTWNLFCFDCAGYVDISLL